jgi:hypothetical protein
VFAVDEVGITWRLLLAVYCQSIVSMPVEIFLLLFSYKGGKSATKTFTFFQTNEETPMNSKKNI